MMTDAWTDRLSDYLDGDLPPDETVRLERHLEGCATCQGVLADLRAVVERAGRLESRPPERDLWPEIAARIGVAAAPEGRSEFPDDGSAISDAEAAGAGGSAAAGPRSWAEEMRRRRGSPTRRFSFSLPQLAAAAVAIVLLSSTMVWLVTSGPGIGGEGTVAVEERPALTSAAVLAGIDERARAGGYDEAVAELETILFYGEEALDTATVRTLRESLDNVDRAISEARTAISEDPGNSYLQQHLGDTMRKKAEFLRQAVTLVATDL